MAASTRMAALTRNATDRATTVSMRVEADGPPESTLVVPATCRDWTRAECRYRLCGITVAPMMPMATYDHARLAGTRASAGRGPSPGSSGCVCGRTKISMK